MKKIICIAGLLLVSSLAWAEDERHSTVDRAIGGMEEGSRIQAPGRVSITDVHKTISASQGTKKANPDGIQPPGNPIVETDIHINPDAGTVEADATVDTTGELEDKQIFDADLDAQEVATVDSSIGSASQITGQETVEEADVTILDQTDQAGQDSGSASGDTQESSGSTNNPIVDADVHVNPESGTIEAETKVDTSGELEEREIIDADVGAGDVVVTQVEVESAADITQSETVKSADVTTQPILTVTPTSTLTAEVDSTGETTGSEAEAGIEADVSGLSEGEDVTCDPSDGLLSSAVCANLRL